MHKTTYICDQCKKEFTEEEYRSKVFREVIINWLPPPGDKYRETHWADDRRAEVCSRKCVTTYIDALTKEIPRELHPKFKIGSFDDGVDNLTTDVWGGAGPDCRTMPA